VQSIRGMGPSSEFFASSFCFLDAVNLCTPSLSSRFVPILHLPTYAREPPRSSCAVCTTPRQAQSSYLTRTDFVPSSLALLLVTPEFPHRTSPSLSPKNAEMFTYALFVKKSFKPTRRVGEKRRATKGEARTKKEKEGEEKLTIGVFVRA